MVAVQSTSSAMRSEYLVCNDDECRAQYPRYVVRALPLPACEPTSDAAGTRDATADAPRRPHAGSSSAHAPGRSSYAPQPRGHGPSSPSSKLATTDGRVRGVLAAPLALW